MSDVEVFEVLPGWQQAEIDAADYLRAIGLLDVALTPPGRDGGIDIRAAWVVAQVKHYSTPIGVRPIRELAGVAGRDRTGLFFSTSGYTNEAMAEAPRLGVALLIPSLDGEMEPVDWYATAKMINLALRASRARERLWRNEAERLGAQLVAHLRGDP